MQIVKCTSNNLDAIAEFYDNVTGYLERNINYPKWTHGEYPARESVRSAIAEGSQYACMEEDRVIGAFIMDDDPRGDYSRGDWKRELQAGECRIVHALAADPALVRNGIGNFMMEFCIQSARQDGYKALRIDVVPTNTPARKLYEKLGFTFAGIKDLNRGIEEIPDFALYEYNF